MSFPKVLLNTRVLSFMNPDFHSPNYRLFYVDWLRVIAFTLLIFYHTGLVFVDWGYHIQNNQFSESMKLPMLFLNQWRLPLLFFVSGLGVRFALGKRSSGTFIRERFIRLFVPLVVGVLFIVPPQVYYESLYRRQFEGSYITFYPMYILGGKLTWNHLWFLPYLLVYSLGALPFFLFVRSRMTGVKRILDWLFNSPAKLILLLIPLVVIEVTLRNAFPDTRNLINDGYNFAFYFYVFLLGYLIGSDAKSLEMIQRRRWFYLLLGISSFLMIYFGWHASGINFLEKSRLGWFAFSILKCLNILSWIFCCFGFAGKYLNRNSQFLAYANESVYPFYIIHQTVLIALAYYVVQFPAGIGAKYAMITFSTFVLSFLIYEFGIRRFAAVHILFGLRQKKELKKTVVIV